MPKDILEKNWIIFGYFGKELENFGKNKSQMRNRKKCVLISVKNLGR